MSDGCIRDILRRHNTPVHQEPYRKYTINETVFSNINEYSAYWLGFLVADGYLPHKNVAKGNQIILDIGTRDYNHLVKFKEFCGNNSPITTGSIKTGYVGSKEAAKVTINSKQKRRKYIFRSKISKSNGDYRKI